MKRKLKKDLNLKEGEWYPGTIIGIEPYNGDYGPSLKILANVNDGERTDEMSVLVADNYKPSTKLGAYVKGILGTLPEEFDDDDLLNKECEVEVAKQRKKDGTVKTNEKTGVPYFTIVGFRLPQQRQFSSDADDFEAVRDKI